MMTAEDEARMRRAMQEIVQRTGPVFSGPTMRKFLGWAMAMTRHGEETDRMHLLLSRTGRPACGLRVHSFGRAEEQPEEQGKRGLRCSRCLAVLAGQAETPTPRHSTKE